MALAVNFVTFVVLHNHEEHDNDAANENHYISQRQLCKHATCIEECKCHQLAK